MKYIYIYGLIDPVLNMIKYVGATHDLSDRYQSHLTVSDTDPTKKAEWIRSLSQQNLKPYLVLLERTEPEKAAQSEVKWAEFYKSNNLYNFFPITPYSVHKGKSELISIRIEHFDIFKLKQISLTMGIKYQTLIKKWIKDKVNEFS